MIIWALLSLFLISGCGVNTKKAGTIEDGYTVADDITLDQLQLPKVGEEIMVITTSKGVIKVRLFESIAPQSIALVKKFISEGFYEGLRFWNFWEDLGYQIEVTEEMVDEAGLTGYEYVEEFHQDYRNFNGSRTRTP